MEKSSTCPCAAQQCTCAEKMAPSAPGAYPIKPASKRMKTEESAGGLAASSTLLPRRHRRPFAAAGARRLTKKAPRGRMLTRSEAAAVPGHDIIYIIPIASRACGRWARVEPSTPYLGPIPPAHVTLPTAALLAPWQWHARGEQGNRYRERPTAQPLSVSVSLSPLQSSSPNSKVFQACRMPASRRHTRRNTCICTQPRTQHTHMFCSARLQQVQLGRRGPPPLTLLGCPGSGPVRAVCQGGPC